MTPDTVEDCIGCGRATQTGTRLFSDRRTTRLEDGTVLHLCGDCNERAISHFGRRPASATWCRSPHAAPGSGWVVAMAAWGPAAGKAAEPEVGIATSNDVGGTVPSVAGAQRR